MEIAISADSSWNKWHPTYKELGERCQRVGVSNLELAYYPENAGFESAQKTLESYGVRVVCVNATAKLRINVLDDPTPAIDNLLASLRLANQLGAKFVVLYPGNRPHWTFYEQTNVFRKLMEPVFQAATDLNLTLLLENHFDLRGEDPLHRDVVRDPDRTAAFFTVMDCPNLKLNFDPGNLYIAGIEPWPYAYRILREFMVYAHFKDLALFSEGLHGPIEKNETLSDASTGIYLPVPVGEGGINYYSLLREMKADNAVEYATFEDHTSADKAEDFYDRGVEFYRKVTADLA